MDGMESDPNKFVMVIGATNLPWELDNAFLRRFDKRIYIGLPDEEGRREIFNINCNKIKVDPEVKENGNWTKLVQLTQGYSGADIANICKDMGMYVIRKYLAANVGRLDSLDMMKEPSEDEMPSLTMEEALNVIQVIKTTLSSDDLTKYTEWEASNGSSIVGLDISKFKF
jgi:katanin p60 ATPase-containing subunit A1